MATTDQEQLHAAAERAALFDEVYSRIAYTLGEAADDLNNEYADLVIMAVETSEKGALETALVMERASSILKGAYRALEIARQRSDRYKVKYQIRHSAIGAALKAQGVEFDDDETEEAVAS